MWRLFKAELKYRLDIFILYGLAFITVFVLTRFIPLHSAGTGNSSFQFQVFMMIFFLVSIPINPWLKEKRTRRFMVLPVSVRQVARARLAVELIYWLLLVCMILVFCLIAGDFGADASFLLSLATQTGIVLTAYFFLSFTADILAPPQPVSSSPIIEKVTASLVFFLLVLLAVVSMTIMFAALQNFSDGKREIFAHIFLTVPGASITLFTGLGLVILSLFLFEHRRSYLMN
jgi:uncharacterized membrane protein YidH (DUF202 family)